MDNNEMIDANGKKSFRIPAGIGLIFLALKSLLVPFEGAIGAYIFMFPLLFLGGIWFWKGIIAESMEFIGEFFRMLFENPGSTLFIGINLFVNLLLAAWGIVVAVLVMKGKKNNQKAFQRIFTITSVAMIVIPFLIETVNWTIVAFFGMFESVLSGFADGNYFLVWIVGLVCIAVVGVVSLILDIAPIVFIVIFMKRLYKKNKTDADRLTNA